ncbi:MAG: PaaI family thioesterase [Bacteroidales bacterium]|nr:PaaI family thioesterase [Bacteroidales bacterium]
MKKIKNPWLNQPGYNCICCSPDNPMGLHLEFWEDGDDILTRWTPTQDYQGWIDTLHGGIQSMLLDEVAGWVVTRKLQTTGVTSKMEVQYLKPVSTRDKGLTIRARISRQMRNVAFIEGEIYDAGGEVCTKASLTYFCASRQMAEEEMGFRGCLLEEDNHQ